MHSGSHSQPRRTALKTLTSLLVGVTTMTAVAGGRRDPSRPEPATGGNRTGAYPGTVDRIVDGEHVVVLLERGGEVVDQVVASSSAYPDLEERDEAVVVLEDGEVTEIRRLPEPRSRIGGSRSTRVSPSGTV